MSEYLDSVLIVSVRDTCLGGNKNIHVRYNANGGIAVSEESNGKVNYVSMTYDDWKRVCAAIDGMGRSFKRTQEDDGYGPIHS